MRKVRVTNIFSAAALALSGCATMPENDPSALSVAREKNSAAAISDSCVEGTGINFLGLIALSNRSYNDSCAQDGIAQTMMVAGDPGMKALGLAAALERGLIDKETFNKISAQLETPDMLDCHVVAIEKGEARLDCAGKPAALTLASR